jgi:hypothetical protein
MVQAQTTVQNTVQTTVQTTAQTTVQAGAEVQGPAAPGGEPDAFCRFGVDLWERLPVRSFDLAALRAGWYVDYYTPYVPGLPHPPALDYAPMLRITQVGTDGYRVNKSWATIDALLAANPGVMWLIGNEPDRRTVQDNVEPHVYAAAYHDLYAYLKQRDPTAQVLAGNIVQATPLRLQYLDMVLDAYRSRFGVPMPLDGWAIHAFLLNEKSCAVYPTDCWGADIPPGITATEGMTIGIKDTARVDLFTAQIERFRYWMAAHGYRDRPLYVTEFGVLLPPSYGYEPPVVNRFMTETFDYLLTARDAAVGYAPDDNRLVQRFAWYAVVEPKFNGGLFEGVNSTQPISPPYVLTALGTNYQAYTRDLTPTMEVRLLQPRFQPELALLQPSAGGADTGEFTATLAITIANAGNLVAPAEVRVAVYDGAPQGDRLLAPVQDVLLRGCGDHAALTFVWRSPADGARSGTVSVVASDASGDTTSMLPYFSPTYRLFLPKVTNDP